MIRAIFEAIYEPMFEIFHDNSNYGFRGGKSTYDAIKRITQKAQNTQWCLEGDIKGAYDNVVFTRLMDILSEKITDKNFLYLIEQGLNSGLVFEGKYHHSIFGTPQGGIASPILFNIYMSKFDEFIHTEVKEVIENWNKTESRTAKPATRIYRKFDLETINTRKRLKKLRIKNQDLPVKLWDGSDRTRYLTLVSDLQLNLKNKRKVPFFDKKHAALRFVYVRYADDWVLFSNCSKNRIEFIKDKISEFLLSYLGLKLSTEKTKITDAKKERVKFLGFSLCYFGETIRQLAISKKSRLKERFSRNKFKISMNNFRGRTNVKRTTGNLLVVGIDQDRLDARLRLKRFMHRKAVRGSRKAEWTVLNDYEIVMRYNYVIRGLVNYYAKSVRDFSQLNKYIYILNYSCAHTLANKHNSSIRKVFKKYGSSITAVQIKKNKRSNKELESSITLLTYIACKKIAEKGFSGPRREDDFLHVRVNWRTVYKLSKYCAICGSTDEVQMHHVKHVTKMGETITGFQRIMSVLNRKQICVCSACHKRIHWGKYDGINLDEFYDPDLASI
jgi:retron-type reverse transcriptase